MRLNKYILPILTGLTMVACSENRTEIQPEATGQSLVLSAHINEGNLIDTRVADGDVVSGSYYLTFTNTSNTLQTVSSPFADGIGYPWIEPSGEAEGRALNWGDIQEPANNAKATLYLDNVSGEMDDKNVVTLDGDTYQATVYNASTSENDIVWGKNDKAEYNATPLSFTLAHKMACVRVNIKVEDGNTNVSESITNNGATVTLLNVKYKAASFNRTSGAVSVNSSEKDDIKLHNGVLKEGGYTPTWIFPPQTFSDTYRPQLQIKLKDGTTYTGALPESMFTNADYTSTAQTLSFSAGQRLTINVVLVQSVGEREILFLPAVVENWVCIGPVGIISRQLGVYSEEDYAAVVKAYNREGGIDEATMSRYATKNADDKWEVNIFATIGTEGETEFPKFNNNTNIVLIFNGWTVYGKSSLNDLLQSNEDGEEEQA